MKKPGNFICYYYIVAFFEQQANLRFSDYNFQGNDPDERAIATFDPEAIANAMETLGYNFAIANQLHEQAKHEADRVLSYLTKDYRASAGSVSGAEAMARSSNEYQAALKQAREAEASKIKAQTSYRASEAYSKMVVTKVSSESKMGEYYKKNLTS